MKLKEILLDAFDIHNDQAEHIIIRERLIDGGQVTGTNMCVLMLAILIASVGLNMNATAVIIGAMLISPLMGSILAAAYGAATIDGKLFRKSLIGFGFQIVTSLIVSTLYFLLSPISSATSELLARTQPTIWDVLIAISGGLAGIIGITRKEKSNVLPGVAIATALMPPLCTCGYGIATGQLRFVLGALYLFIVNSYFIFLSSWLVLLLLKVPQLSSLPDKVKRRMKGRLIRNTIFVIIPTIFVAVAMVSAQQSDATSLTGFTQTESQTAAIVRQVEVLFPEVKAVKVSETVQQGTEESQIAVEVSVSKEIPAELLERIDAWLDLAYGQECTVSQTVVGETVESINGV